MAVGLLKLGVAGMASAIMGYGFREKHRANHPEDTVHDKWWRPHFRAYLRAGELLLAALFAWYALSYGSPAHRPWHQFEAAAACLAILGGSLRLWAMHVLGKLFTFEVAIRKDHTLQRRGPYAVVRHPSYTGALAGLTGLLYFLGGPGDVMRRWEAWAMCFPVGTAFLVLRVSNEEQMLASHFGAAWTEYRASTWGLLPFVY